MKKQITQTVIKEVGLPGSVTALLAALSGVLCFIIGIWIHSEWHTEVDPLHANPELSRIEIKLNGHDYESRDGSSFKHDEWCHKCREAVTAKAKFVQ